MKTSARLSRRTTDKKAVKSSERLSRMMRRRKNESVKFEKSIRPSLRRLFPLKKGWEIKYQKTLENGLRVDYFLRNTKYAKERYVVVEAKNVRELTISHVRQVEKYQRTFRVSLSHVNLQHHVDFIAVPSGAKVSKEVKAELKFVGIKVIHTRFRKRAR